MGVEPRRWILGAALSLVAACSGGDPPQTNPTAPSPSEAAPPPSEPSSPPRDLPATTVRVLTYNILASPIFPDLRREAILEVLAQADADILALQEVPPWMLTSLTSQSGPLSNYRATTQDGAPFAPGGQLLLARHDITDVTAAVLPGRQRRTVLLATVHVAGRALRVATSHMESYLKDGPIRARQLDAIFAMLAGAEHAVFLGDFNFGDGEQPDSDRLDPAFVDVWRLLHPDDPGFTWNIDESPLARIGAFSGEPSRRLDRILVRSAHLTPKAIRIIGNAPVAERTLTLRDRAMIEPPDREEPNPGEPTIAVFPSDHYGLLAELTLNGS